MELPPQYNPKEVEEKIYRLWEESGYFNPDRLPKEKRPRTRASSVRGRHQTKAKTFCITVPPPNITGSLHMGHALNATIQDILIRKKRMEGYKTLWLPGTDHAGIATQNVVEKELKKQGMSRHDLGREKFIEKIWEWKEKYGNIILDQFKKLGCSMDWTRTRFTMDPDYQKAVETAFLYYYKKGWIYRGERTINWCTRCATGLSDLEIEYKEEVAKIYFIKYGPLILATVRPETKLGDTALAVNPRDERYRQYIKQEVIIQSVDSSIPRDQPPKLKNIRIKVVADKAADPEFGTGVIKVTPAHDVTDFEIYERHPEIPILKVIGENGRMTKEAGVRYEELKIMEAREQIVNDLKTLGLLERVDDYTHNIALCYRCGGVIEPLLSKQWFLKMDALARLAIKSVRSGRVKFHPVRFEKVYFDWLKNVKNWCVSRQIWWGHRIPLEGETDVFDTWFSSALWPLATLGWPQQTEDLKTFYPTSVLSTARDIINLWVARMIFSGREFAGREPFRDVVIHATILTKEGKRMSKSLGTGVDPMNLIQHYGADATRFGLIWQTMGNQDIHWSEEHVVAGKKFCNKLWNAARFVLANLQPNRLAQARAERATHNPQSKPTPKTAEDKKILVVLQKVTKEVDKRIEKYEFGPALHILYDFFWHEFCDKYIEESKKSFNQEVLSHVLGESLKLLHPFMPFITEEIWNKLPVKNKNLLIVARWPLS